MKKANKLSLISIKVKSFTTSLSTNESFNIRAGEESQGQCHTNNLMVCTTIISGKPKCDGGPDNEI